MGARTERRVDERQFLADLARSNPMTVERMSQDGIEVAEYLKTRFPSSPIVLLGHSWGTILGVHMIKQRPDLFAALRRTGGALEPSWPPGLFRNATVERATSIHGD
jgi:pimeloyl-ACP methyl ester carboxylesterase